MKGIAIPPMALISKLMQRPNRNLLDNPWFTVNQRGFTTTTARSAAYGFDRWIGTYRYNSNPAMAFSANEYAFQFFEDSFKNELHGKTVTVSVKYSDGTIEHGTCTYQKNPSEFVTIFNGKVNVAIGYDADSSSHINGAIAITGLQSCNVAAIKLELGSLSTLKYDIAPNYTEELLKCQRYFVRIGNGEVYPLFGSGIAESTTNCYPSRVLSVPMRVRPSLECSNGWGCYDGSNFVVNVQVNLNNDNMPTTEVQRIGLRIWKDDGGYIALRWYDFECRNFAGWIFLSADL